MGIEINIIAVVCHVLLYFIPSFIGKGKKHFMGILFLNILLGWTFIFWVVALIWALKSPKENVGTENNSEKTTE